MKRQTGFLLVCLAMCLGTIAWLLWPRAEEIEIPSPRPTMELAKNETEPNVSASSASASESSNRTVIVEKIPDNTLGERARTIPPPANQARTPSSIMPARSIPGAASQLDRSSRAALPPNPNGDPVNPFDGTPEPEIVGIGAVLARPNGELKIMSVLPGTPAGLAGLSGYIVKSVDGVELAGLPLQECVNRLRGEIGTKVKLDLLDPNGDPVTKELVRDRVQVPKNPVPPSRAP